MPTRSVDGRPATARRAAATALCALVLTFTGCSRCGQGSAPPSQARDITIASGAQGSYGGLRIGLGPIQSGEYVLKSGEHAEGRVAELWLSYRDDPSKNKKVLAKLGERVEIGKYAFTVAYIHGGQGAVDLRFDTSP